MILNNSYTTITTQNSSINCGCNGTNNQTIVEPCSSLYGKAMLLYLQDMFGDLEFYEDWFFINFDNGEKFANDVLIENLELFVKEFIELDFNLDFTSNKTYKCDCDDISLSNSSIQYKKLNNFLSILNWVNNNKIDENSNKIKMYGKEFGELLPKLQF
jgi:hypothetical protein